jgi:hypothetical protein
LRRGFDLVRTGEVDLAMEQLRTFPLVERPVDAIDREARNLRVYLMVVRAEKDEARILTQAADLLEALAPNPVAVANQAWLRRRRALTRNDRGPCDNPYLLLGTDHGAGEHEWRRAWRKLSRRYRDDIDRLSAVNRAKDRIEALERAGYSGLGEVFVVPLVNENIHPHVGSPWQSLVPAAEPLPKLEGDRLLRLCIEELRAAVLSALMDRAARRLP